MGLFTSTKVGQHRILDFDIENRPLTYWWGDKTTAEITAIAWGWADEDEIEVRTLAPPPDDYWTAQRMLLDFLRAYDEADVVTGHYIRGHDLPTINAHLIEMALPPLQSKLVIDTKTDLVKHANLSVSQQALGAMLDVKYPKIAMPQTRWRDANRLTPEGREAAVQRVVGDVRQHKAMRLELTELGYLRPPKLWTP